MDPRSSPLRWILYLSATFLVAGAIALVPHGNFLQEQTAVPGFWRAMAIMNAGFVLSWFLPKQLVSSAVFWTVAIATRVAALGMYPGDDIWRYLWEGYVQTQGFSPYDLAPDAAVLEPLRQGWWSMINHKDVSAIYPPLTQLGFWLISLLSSSVHLFKLGFVAADLGICALLSRRFGHGATLLYAWNPLVIYCFAGGAHYDSWFLLPLVVAWLWQNPPRSPFLKGGWRWRLSLDRAGKSALAAGAGDLEAKPQTTATPPFQKGGLGGFRAWLWQNPPRSPFPKGGWRWRSSLDGEGTSALAAGVGELKAKPQLTATPPFLKGGLGGFRPLNAAFWLGCSIAVKWVSLPILSFLVWQQFWQGQFEIRQLSIRRLSDCLKQARWLAAAAVALVGLAPVVVTALPYCSLASCPLIPTGSTFVSHGRSAEWIPHWVAQSWQASLSTNSIYAIPLVMAIAWLLLRARSFGQFAEWYFISLLLLSPIVHAWYFTWLAPFAVASRNWGTRLISISALVYFVLPYQVSQGDPSWWLVERDRLLLWLPFCIGLLISAVQAQLQPPGCSSTLTQG